MKGLGNQIQLPKLGQIRLAVLGVALLGCSQAGAPPSLVADVQAIDTVATSTSVANSDQAAGAQPPLVVERNGDGRRDRPGGGNNGNDNNGNGKGPKKTTSTSVSSTTLNSTTTSSPTPSTTAPSTTNGTTSSSSTSTTTVSSTTRSTTTASTTTTTAVSTTSTNPTTSITAPPSSQPCTVEPGGTANHTDFAALAASNQSATALNGSNNTIFRTVYALNVPDEMAYIDNGLRIRFDAADQPASGQWTNEQSRSEMRTATIDVAPVEGSTVAYCMYFDADHSDLYGPATIFQSFSRDLDGPAIGIELTGLNQFSDAIANEIQVVAYDGRHRIRGVKLRRNQPNALQVVIHYDSGSAGGYQVSLNGSVLHRAGGLNTSSSRGVWWQYGLYLHGLKQDPALDSRNRRVDQLASGNTTFESTYRMVERVVYQPGERSGGSDLSRFGTSG